MEMNDADVRWMQRFENYQKSMSLLERYSDYNKDSELERAGIIQFFEMTFELSWKLLKDYLEAEGFVIVSPRDAIKQAYQSNIIQNGDLWMEALNSRNLLSHTYEEEIALEISEKIIHEFLPEFLKLANYFKDKSDDKGSVKS